MNKTRLGLLATVLLLTINPLFSQVEKTVAAYARSLEKEKKSDYFGAIKCILDLNDSTIYENNLRLGWLYYKAGFEKRSLKYYQAAIQLKPNALEPRIGFGYPAYLLEDFSHLIEQDKKILEIDPNNKNTNSNLALIYYYNKEHAKALPYFQKVEQMYPFDYDNTLNLAWTCYNLSKKAEAEKYFNVVLLYSPTDASAKEGLDIMGKSSSGNQAQIDAFAKSYEFAAANNQKAAANVLKDNYDKSSYYMNLRLGWLTHLLGQENEAGAYYKIAAELKPQSIEAKLGCAIPAEVMGNKTELKSIYESILAIDPQNTVINYKLGNLYYEKKEYATALKHFEKVTTLYPFDYDGLLMCAWANYQVNNYNEARTLFYKVLCLSPGDRSATTGLTYKPVEEQRKLENKEIIRPK
ncbi:MAG: tetratricopeptide repeat protein [Bacteroidia bacterium]|nr:tetratricopeptide repeat protein [Bacteroidia bacterium]